MLDQLVSEELLEVCADPLQFGHAVHSVSGEMKAVEIVHDRHIERSGSGALFFVAANVQVVVIISAICEAMNQPRDIMIAKIVGFSVVNSESKSWSESPCGCSLDGEVSSGLPH